MTLVEINDIYINQDAICLVYSVAELMDDTKIHYYVELVNGQKIEISKTDYDDLTT